MIRYRLQCQKSHEFEAWFKSSTDYERQEKRGLVSCPDCGSTKVGKALMAPGVATRKGRGDVERQQDVRTGDSHADQGEVTVESASPESRARAEMQRQFLKLMREVRKEVETNAEYVGPKFAEEARKIHFKDAEERRIWGEATREEVRELNEDGIECLPLPPLPDDKN
jgi:hypothetical protein